MDNTIKIIDKHLERYTFQYRQLFLDGPVRDSSYINAKIMALQSLKKEILDGRKNILSEVQSKK